MADNRVARLRRRRVRQRAGGCCEYCRSQEQFDTSSSFSVDHILPVSAGGSSESDNLALACQGCNNHKYTKTRAIDPASGDAVTLFHPRRQGWDEHFVWSADYTQILGRTPTGRATVEALRLNRPGLVRLRGALYQSGNHPPGLRQGREAPDVRDDWVTWVERELPEVPGAERGEAVLVEIEAALPIDPEDLRSLGILAWALDYFPGRSEDRGEREEAREIRDALLAPLRQLRPPPKVAGEGWAQVPGGSFGMGSKKGDDEEQPVHEVTLSPFSMLDHPVTNRELRRLLVEVKSEDELPAVNIDWYHAYTYAAWLGGRLPTEAEWEYACRAGTETEYWSGNEEADLARVGWYSKNSGYRFHPVGEKPPNPWRLFDMHGNVWEWTADWFDSGWYAKPEASQPNPWGPPSGVYRVLRGGSFGSDADRARAAYRKFRDPETGFGNPGFRVVVPGPPEPVELGS